MPRMAWSTWAILVFIGFFLAPLEEKSTSLPNVIQHITVYAVIITGAMWMYNYLYGDLPVTTPAEPITQRSGGDDKVRATAAHYATKLRYIPLYMWIVIAMAATCVVILAGDYDAHIKSARFILICCTGISLVYIHGLIYIDPTAQASIAHQCSCPCQGGTSFRGEGISDETMKLVDETMKFLNSRPVQNQLNQCTKKGPP